jgi:hypothetical protein
MVVNREGDAAEVYWMCVIFSGNLSLVQISKCGRQSSGFIQPV